MYENMLVVLWWCLDISGHVQSCWVNSKRVYLNSGNVPNSMLEWIGTNSHGCHKLRILLKSESCLHCVQKEINIANSTNTTYAWALLPQVVHKFKMRSDIQSYHLGGMGCSSGVIAVNLIRDLLVVRAPALSAMKSELRTFQQVRLKCTCKDKSWVHTCRSQVNLYFLSTSTLKAMSACFAADSQIIFESWCIVAGHSMIGCKSYS